MFDDVLKKLQELEFKSNHSMKVECLNYIVKTDCQITKNEKHTIKNKTTKSWKRTRNNVLFGV